MSFDDLRGTHAEGTAPLPIKEAAAVLSVPAGTLRRWIREGCPHVPGRRGRGCATLVDVQAVKQWRQANDRDAVLLDVAALPDVLASAALVAWKESEGATDRRRLAGITAATWFALTNAALEHLRNRGFDIPELQRLPDEIEYLFNIARQ